MILRQYHGSINDPTQEKLQYLFQIRFSKKHNQTKNKSDKMLRDPTRCVCVRPIVISLLVDLWSLINKDNDK